MATITRGTVDEYVERIKSALDAYEVQYPGAVATLYRQDPASIRIRIVDARFKGMSKGDRHDQVWDFLAARLDDDTIEELSILLPLAPEEQPSSFMNAEFEDPIPSGL